MGGSGQRGPRPFVDPTGRSAPGPSGQESGHQPRRDSCPTDFAAEVTDIPEEMQDRAAAVEEGTALNIELREGDPAFLLDADILGWLATNIDEVTQCLKAGWTYQAQVDQNAQSPAGALIRTTVRGQAPAST